jgi:hypothetical protein
MSVKHGPYLKRIHLCKYTGEENIEEGERKGN